MAALGVRFLLELGALAALGWWGSARVPGLGSYLLAVGLPLAAAVWWGALVAPRARRRLRDPARFAAESLVWASATAALWDLTSPAPAAGFAALALVTALAARKYEPTPPAA
ncbi:MAG: YrdB family protein [Sandaracinaceae bacterium]|nr:YrdB family protein [Sandaracinaceae bacterium]